MRTHGAVVGRRFRSVTKLTTKVRMGRGYLWGIFLIAAAALKTPTRNDYNAQGVNLKRGRLPAARFFVGLVLVRMPLQALLAVGATSFVSVRMPCDTQHLRKGGYEPVYIYIYIYIYIYMCVCIYTCICVYICIYNMCGWVG